MSRFVSCRQNAACAPHNSNGLIKKLEIIQDCYAIYRRIEEELNLTHVAAHAGTQGNELAERMAMLGPERKEELRPYQRKVDIPF